LDKIVTQTAQTGSGSTGNLYISRLLTRSGDQAWDFVLPLALIVLFPEKLQYGIGLFFLSKLIFALISPAIGSHMDAWTAKAAVRRGIGLQTAAVVAGAALIFVQQQAALGPDHLLFWFWYAAVTLSLVTGGIGSMIMDTFVNQEIVPALFSGRLTEVNARIRQIDLATEVGSPVVTGLVLAGAATVHPLAGFTVVAAWNVVSFLPEYLLLRPLCRELARIGPEKIIISTPQSIFSKYREGFQAFRRHRLALPILAYSMLWFSALSPHGVLLTTFLKGGWQLPEAELGYFRALGALCGVGATFLFPWFVGRFGLMRTSAGFIIFQALTVVAALIFFTQVPAHWFFLGAILLSRIGLYGFIQGETEFRQSLSRPGERGQLNGFGSALNQSATILLFLAGTRFTSPDDFVILTAGSAFCVCLGAVTFLIWAGKEARLKGVVVAA
jgi:iron-regulated transporter 1